MENSAFMKARYQMNTWNKDVADTKAFLDESFGGVPTRYKTARNALAHTYFWPIARMQMLVDEMTFMAGMYEGVKNKNLSEEQAVHYADSVVENSQTSGIFSDRSAIERGSVAGVRQQQFIKIWTTLISYMLAKGNIAYSKGAQLARKPTLWNATKFATDLVMLFTVEAVLSTMIRGRFPDFDDQDDDEPGMWKWLLDESLASAASGIPIIREIPSARYGSGNTPLGSLAKDMYNAMIQAEQGEFDPALFKAWNNVGGTLFHYPSTFMNRQFDAWYRDNILEEDVPAIDYWTGQREREE